MTSALKPQGFARGNNALDSILKKVKKLQALDALLTKHLDPDVREHTIVANINDGCLVLQTDSPAWDTRIRYLLPDLLAKLRKEKGLQGLGSIRTYIGLN